MQCISLFIRKGDRKAALRAYLFIEELEASEVEAIYNYYSFTQVSKCFMQGGAKFVTG